VLGEEIAALGYERCGIIRGHNPEVGRGQKCMQPPGTKHAQCQEVVAGPHCGYPLLFRIQIAKAAGLGEAVAGITRKKGVACTLPELKVGNDPGSF